MIGLQHEKGRSILKVLQGKTKGYRNHPQLERFKNHPDPLAAIEAFLQQVYKESLARGYHFNAGKIKSSELKILKIKVTRGQVAFEVYHLSNKLKSRDPKKFHYLQSTTNSTVNPIFKVVPGTVEKWEK